MKLKPAEFKPHEVKEIEIIKLNIERFRKLKDCLKLFDETLVYSIELDIKHPLCNVYAAYYDNRFAGIVSLRITDGNAFIANLLYNLNLEEKELQKHY